MLVSKEQKIERGLTIACQFGIMAVFHTTSYTMIADSTVIVYCTSTVLKTRPKLSTRLKWTYLDITRPKQQLTPRESLKSPLKLLVKNQTVVALRHYFVQAVRLQNLLLNLTDVT